MRPPARFRGLPVSAGTAAGVLAIVGDTVDGTVDQAAAKTRAARATPEEVAAAFAAVAAERSALAGRLRAAGRGDQADIIEIAALIAADPALGAQAVAAVRGGADAVTAVRESAERHAVAMESLPNPALAERAADIRQVAGAVIDRLGTKGADSPRSVAAVDSVAGAGAGDFILVRREVTAADLIELADAGTGGGAGTDGDAGTGGGGGTGGGLIGAVSVVGGASSHAAIIARGLGLPMIVGVDPGVLALPPGQTAVLDADSGELVVGARPIPGARGTADWQRAAGVHRSAGAREASKVVSDDPLPAGPVRTADGREIVVLCNVASAAETRRGLAAGAVGVGLLRTEIPYVQATDWPTRAQHLAQLGPILALLAGRTATVRLLDFSGDKIPPFLATGAAAGAGAVSGPGAGGSTGGGLAALLGHPSALGDQVRAVLEAGRETRLGVLIPMVSSLGEVRRVREVLVETAGELGLAAPSLGIMVELESAAMNAAAFASAVDFFSIGTNDLTGDVLGLGRRDQAAGPGLAAHPRVLALVKRVVAAGKEAGITVSVCGDAAADGRVLPLLLGVGVEAVSVPAARVATVRSWISNVNAGECAELAGRALLASSAAEVWDLVPAL
jgi:phosphoenolpyruvate-protein kinase (PTS system EI component)